MLCDEKTNMYLYYVRPFSITDSVIHWISYRSRSVGILEPGQIFENNPHLRRSNWIRSIHSSLVIENNALSLLEVTDVINGKKGT